MRKALLLGIALTMVSTVVLAGAVKVELLPFGPGDPDSSGQAILNYAKGKDATEVQLNCWGLMPGMEYTAYLKSPAGWHAIGTFVVRRNGTGNLHVKLPGDHSWHLPVAVNNDANFTVLLGE